jgi:glycerol-3-phosphate cytidylyltransferase
MLRIDTKKGPYNYKLIPLYNGSKKINKVVARENLLIFNSIAQKNKLKFGLCYGTLLGAIREHDFIEHDEDIDLFIIEENKKILLEMLFDLQDSGFNVARYDRRGGLLSIMRNDEYIDIYIFSPLMEGVRAALGDPIPEKYIMDLVEYDFQGEKFLGAKDSEEMMLFFYGSNWMIPIQTNDFNQPFYKKWIYYLIWYIYYYMPDFLFNKIIKPRERKKIDRYYKRKERLCMYKNINLNKS